MSSGLKSALTTITICGAMLGHAETPKNYTFSFDISMPQLKDQKLIGTTQDGTDKIINGNLEGGNGFMMSLSYSPWKNFVFIKLGYDRFTANGSIFDGNGFIPTRLIQNGPNIGIGIQLALPGGANVTIPSGAANWELIVLYRRQTAKYDTSIVDQRSSDINKFWFMCHLKLHW